MYLSEQMRKRGVRLREPRDHGIKGSEAKGLQAIAKAVRDGKGDLEQREREQVMATALAQPHRAGSDYDPDDGSELGRFCKRHWRGNKEVRQTRRLAGEQFAQTLNDERVARGLPGRQWSPSVDPVDTMSDEELEKRRVLTAERRRKAEEAIREVDDRTVRVMERLCYDDMPISATDEGRAEFALYKLSVHFELERRGYHDDARLDAASVA